MKKQNSTANDALETSALLNSGEPKPLLPGFDLDALKVTGVIETPVEVKRVPETALIATCIHPGPYSVKLDCAGGEIGGTCAPARARSLVSERTLRWPNREAHNEMRESLWRWAKSKTPRFKNIGES